MLPIKQVDDVLQDSVFADFVLQSQESDLNFRQQYPCRLFSDKEHRPWLQQVFNNFIMSTAMPFCAARSLQQIFLGFELPGSNFMLHRSHQDIAGVAIISLDDFADVRLACLTDSFDDPEDYLGSAGTYKKETYEFKKNSALIIKNTDPRHHWGFTGYIPKNQLKRSVWIYLGKQN